MLEQLDILITGSSRPELFPYCLESFKRMIHFSGRMRFILHEDFVLPNKSDRVIGLSSIEDFDCILKTNPAQGLGNALVLGLKEVQTPFVFYLQEDWEFERPVDLDLLLYVMQQYDEINSFIFNKNRNFSGQMSFPMHECLFLYEVKACVSPGWFLLPSLWRTEFIRQRWKPHAERPEGKFTRSFGSHEQRKDSEFCKREMGAFLLGPAGDYRYVRHLGDSWRMAPWRMQGGKPGGNDISEAAVKTVRAPWLPPLPPRPSTKTKSGWYPEYETN